MFAGETFEQDVEYQRLKNLLIGQCFSVTFVLLYCCCTFYSTHTCNSNVTVHSLYNVFKCPLFLPIDFFRGPVVSQVRLAGLEHVIMVTATEGKILIRNYRFIFIALVRITVSFQETVSSLLYKYSVDQTPDLSVRFECLCVGEFWIEWQTAVAY